MPENEWTYRVPVAPANPAPPAPVFPWPGGHRCAMQLSFDVDGETAWTSKDPSNAERLVTMSYGGYEARVGVPKLLDMLRSLGLRATFYITGWCVEAHPAMAEAIQAGGHEIAHHGYHHLMPDPAEPDAMREELERGLDTLKRRLGVVPAGYRAPYGESFEGLRASLKTRGFLYSSSWRDDVRPYRQVLADGTPGVIELPVTMSYDDWLYGLTHRFSPRPLFTREHVLSIWQDELEETRDWGGLVTTVLHPQVSGRPMRLRLLREFLGFAQNLGGVWIATGREIADYFASCETLSETYHAVQPVVPR
ncbi:MAG TPA: polysaccharide deacetylase [Stellaceae bacterium]|nr:polysaccharide deacetylase [Stellaceae bacterium]